MLRDGHVVLLLFTVIFVSLWTLPHMPHTMSDHSADVAASMFQGHPSRKVWASNEYTRNVAYGAGGL